MKNEIMTNENKGFSLVELIVVIAIMAVMTSVLAPSLLGYVEQSRMQKDDSAMGEVNNAIKLALADQDVYDECLAYNVTNNYSCYVDDKNAATTYKDAAFMTEDKNNGDTKGTVESADYWHYNDDCRLADETEYYAAGNMRGMTITFTAGKSSNEAKFDLASARINSINQKIDTRALSYKYVTPKKAVTLETMTSKGDAATAGAKNTGKLYNKLRAVIGDSVVLSSQTYRNSEYTVFIRMGSMGGNNAGAQDAVAVYGQWSGTNLSSVATTTTTGGTT